jgi:hypothetical protein
MTSSQGASIASGMRTYGWLRELAHSPALVFLMLSALFGPLILVLTPPLCGPDESAHFMRAYGLFSGEIVPGQIDDKGRKGVPLSAKLYRDFDLFEGARYRVNDATFNYGDVMAEYIRRRADDAAPGPDAAPVFVLYAGSEGYGPLPYIPYVAAATLADRLDLDFVGTVYLMRLFGFVATTAIAAYAIAVVPHLGWAFLAIAMLPAALYCRAMISADGAALAGALAVAAVSLRGVGAAARDGMPERLLWMTLCVLSKPPQIAFILLEAIGRPLKDIARQWRAMAVVVLPPVLLTLIWAVASGGDMATWRLTEPSGLPPEQFEPAWKLGYMLAHPLHFPTLLIGNASNYLDLWRQLIGVLGWLDLVLLPFVYPTVSLLLIATFPVRLGLDPGTRRRIALLAGLSAIGYALALFLIFYVAWTPMTDDHIGGIQGRYFIVTLPLVALCVAALVNRAPHQRITTAAAVLAALVSGAATIEGILRVDWRLWS